MLWRCPCVRPCVRASVRPSVNPSEVMFSGLFSEAFSDFELVLGIWLDINGEKIQFQFQKNWPHFSWVMALEHRIFQQFYSLPDFFSQPLQLLNWNLKYAFIMNNYRSSSSFRKKWPLFSRVMALEHRNFQQFYCWIEPMIYCVDCPCYLPVYSTFFVPLL